ncbi:MAG: class IV adenylate cyclase [Planctomycetota bacterium]|nr:class IV adenylate cyclase [Planctomycetota bacterium]
MSFLFVAGPRGGHNADVAKEIEIKYRLPHPRALHQTLRKAGAAFLGRALVRDEYFDTPGQSLLAADVGLRLRCERTLARGEGKSRREGEGILTCKGPAERSSRVKIRREWQTGVENPRATGQLLAGLGFVPTVLIEKKRSSYRLGPCSVELDELPLLGAFVEVEGPSVRAVERTVAKLGLTGEAIRDHYVNLVRAECQRIGRSCRRVTLAACRCCRHRPGRRAAGAQ